MAPYRSLIRRKTEDSPLSLLLIHRLGSFLLLLLLLVPFTTDKSKSISRMRRNNMMLPSFVVVWLVHHLLLAQGFLPPVLMRSPSSSSLRVTTMPPRMISSGFSYDDDEQLLVSVQKPLGLVLEEQECNDSASRTTIVVVELLQGSSAARAGVAVGDRLLAVQNADMTQQTLETVMEYIRQAPPVVNLRFQRAQGRGGGG